MVKIVCFMLCDFYHNKIFFFFLEKTIKTEFKGVVVYKEGWGRIGRRMQVPGNYCQYSGADRWHHGCSLQTE